MLCAYHYPEEYSSRNIDCELIEFLVKKGNEVIVLTPTPTRGVTKEQRKKYKKKKMESLFCGKLTIRRFTLFEEKQFVLFRFIRYIILDFCEYLIGVKIGKKENIDLIYFDSTPPTHGLLAGLLKKKLNVPIVFSLQDVSPDSMVSSGMIKTGSLLWKLGRKIEDYTYNISDHIIVISSGIADNIRKKGVDESKISLIYHWIDCNKVKNVKRKNNYIFDKYSIPEDSFIVSYAGLLGYSQNLEVLIEAASMTRDLDIKYVIIGDGPKLEDLKRIAERLYAMNVVFLPRQPSDKISEIYSLGDIEVVTINTMSASSAMPSKTWNIVACERPVMYIGSETSELNTLINSYKFGVCCNGESALQVKDLVLQLYRESAVREEMGRKGREFAIESLEKARALEAYLRIFEKEASRKNN
jgi:glycosyltransferase involved in cell wall biosynthesis